MTRLEKGFLGHPNGRPCLLDLPIIMGDHPWHLVRFNTCLQ